MDGYAEQRTRLLEVIGRNPEGATLEEIETFGSLGIPRRTMQRRLHALVQEGVLQVSGQTRARRYRVAATPPGRSEGFIDLHRVFFEIADTPSEPSDEYDLYQGTFGRAQTWDQILTNPCSVIIAEAGAGKTTEFRHQAITRRAHKRSAFFCRLDLLINAPLVDCFEVGTMDEFVRWQTSEDRAVFFLDSVDEAKLTRHSDFERAITNFINAIDAHKDRCIITISTRPGAWHPQADAEMLCRRLGLRRPKSNAANAGQPDPDRGVDLLDEMDTEEESDVANRRDLPPPLVVYRMAPLTAEQIQIFAAAQKAADIDQFLQKLKDTDAEELASRPDDLPGLLDVWRDKRRIASRGEIVEINVKLKLQSQSQGSLSFGRALVGAEALAAAVTFTRRNSILLSDTSVERAVRAKCVEPWRVLPDWNAADVSALLSRPLFDPSLFGSVRFYHRTACEYLTASWLKRMLDQGSRRRNVENLFFRRAYGGGEHLVVPSLKPVAAWLAAWDQSFRDKLIEIDPDVLLEHGDPSLFDEDTRTYVLKSVVNRYREQRSLSLHLSPRELRRLAGPGLGEIVHRLLCECRHHERLRQLLLRIVRECGQSSDLALCGQIALELALDATADCYTRVNAFDACGVVADVEQKKKLRLYLLANAATLDREILGAALGALFQDDAHNRVLSIDDVVTILETAVPGHEYSIDRLSIELDQLAGGLKSAAEKWRLLGGLERLLSKPPLHSEHFCRVSERYAWLLRVAARTAGDLLELEVGTNFDSAMLSVFLMATQANNVPRFTGDVHKEAHELIETNPDLKHAMFWHAAEQVRRRVPDPSSAYRYFGHDLWPIWRTREDFERLLRDLRGRSSTYDRLVALEALLYGGAGEVELDVSAIEEAVVGTPELEARLAAYRAPRRESKEERASRLRFERLKRQRAARAGKQEAERKAWVARLKAEPAQVGDLSLAAQGGLLYNTAWLIDAIRARKDSHSSLAVSDWNLLVDEFGDEVAHNFRDFCQSYWRAYEPKLRSELGGDQSSIPWAVTVGLSGLAMEAHANPRWFARLSPDEATRATRYALWELNDFPSWTWSLLREHPGPVTTVLVHEMRWELQQPHREAPSGYVLSRLRWAPRELAQSLRPRIFELLQDYEDPEVTALAQALTVILRDPSPVPKDFVDHIAARSETKTDVVRQSLWLSSYVCVDANNGIKSLARWLAGVDRTEGEHRMSRVLNHIWGDRYDSLMSQHRSFMKAEHLCALLKLAHSRIRLEDDVSHEGAYTPSARDHAQELRSRLLGLLWQLPGRRTYDALIELAELYHGTYFGDRLRTIATERAGADSEGEPWTTNEVAAFAAESEREPATQLELFKIALSRLDDLKLEIEEGDESEASLLQKVDHENELRRVLANRLKKAARGKYTTGSEEELADETRTDIRLHHPLVDERIPIEIKIADKKGWSAAELRERLEHQLVDQYLRWAKYGIYLLVRRGGPSDRKTWRLPGVPRAGFKELVSWLAKEASALRDCRSLGDLQVVAIDLTKRGSKTRRRTRGPSRYSTHEAPHDG